MPAHADFFQAIAARPEEDAPRLIYADWLEEQGDMDRAEFIRVQCELAQVSEAEPRRVGLEYRQNQLLQRHCTAWLAALPVQPFWRMRNGTYYEYQRGFLTALCVSTTEFLTHAQALFAAAPLLEHVRFKRLDRRLLASLLQSPFLEHLTALDFSYERLEDAALETLTTASLENVTALYLTGNELGDDAARYVASAQGLHHLTLLDLAYNRVGNDGAQALIQADSLYGLQLLRLDRNPIDWEVRERLRWLLSGRGCQFSCEPPAE